MQGNLSGSRVRYPLAMARQFTHWIRLLEGLTRTENVHAWMGQMVQYDWSEHLTDHNLRAHIELKKHILDLRAHNDSKKLKVADCQLGTWLPQPSLIYL